MSRRKAAIAHQVGNKLFDASVAAGSAATGNLAGTWRAAGFLVLLGSSGSDLCKTWAVSKPRKYGSYVAKMKDHVHSGTDLEVDVRFIDMLSDRRACILDIGCGIGNAVSGLRARGHEAYGVDPTAEVLAAAKELYNPSWFRQLAAGEITPEVLIQNELPVAFDLIVMSGNVPSFLLPDELEHVFGQAAQLLRSGGILIAGTTTAIQGGPADQDKAAGAANLSLLHRYADWHLLPFTAESPWSVSVFTVPGSRKLHESPDGMFVLKE